MLKFSKNISFKAKKIRKENEASLEIFKNILFVSVESSKLNNYSTLSYEQVIQLGWKFVAYTLTYVISIHHFPFTLTSHPLLSLSQQIP
jgi:hypothetical protein